MKKYFILFVFLFFSWLLFSQNTNNLKFDKNKLYTGGNLGVQFGTYTVIDISPIIGYYLTEKFAAGLGIIYQYYGYRDKYYPSLNFNTNIYGTKFFLRYNIFQSIFAHAEYEALSLETEYFDPYNYRHNTPRFIVHSMLIGGGYRQPIGEYSSINLMLLYNINETIDSPYKNPIIRMGFDIGL